MSRKSTDESKKTDESKENTGEETPAATEAEAIAPSPVTKPQLLQYR